MARRLTRTAAGGLLPRVVDVLQSFTRPPPLNREAAVSREIGLVGPNAFVSATDAVASRNLRPGEPRT